MLTLRPLCQEGMDYVEEQLLLRGFDKRGKLFVRRSGPIVATVYPCWEHGRMEDYTMGFWLIWLCPDKIFVLRNNGRRWLSTAGGIMMGSIPEPTPEFPFRKVTKMSHSLLKYYLRGLPEDSLCRWFGADFEELRWEHVQEVLDCTFLTQLDFLANYEGERACVEFIRNTKHLFNLRYFLMYEKNLPDLREDLLMEEKLRSECIQQYGEYPDMYEKKYQQALQILQAAEGGDWGPAERLLAEKSAGGLALLKRYHIEDKGPYPVAYARQRFDV